MKTITQVITSQILYVSTTGNDTNSGIAGSPVRTLQKAMAIAGAGCRIFVRGGTYAPFIVTKSNLFISSYNNESVIISGGTGIRLNGVTGVTINGFEVFGASGAGVFRLGAIFIYGGSHNTISYCIVHDNLLEQTNGVKIQDSPYNKILYVTSYNNGGAGVSVIGQNSPADHNEIGYCVIYGNVRNGSNADGVGLMDGADYTYIHHNNVYGNGDDGIDAWSTRYNIISYNIVHDQILNDGNGYKLGYGGENTVTSNTAHGNKARGFSDNGGGGNYYLNNASYNNGTCGFESIWRVEGDARISSFEDNVSYDNGTDFCLDPRYTVLI